MTNTTTQKILQNEFDCVNGQLEEIGSKYRLTKMQPWDKERLAITDTEHYPSGGCIRTFSQSTKSEMYDTLEVMYDLLLRLKQEKNTQ